MRELYNRFFYIPKHGKIRENVMLVRIFTTVAVIIGCLIAMSVSAYAYFSYNVISGSNMIKGASFEANVSIAITDENHAPVILSTDGPVRIADLPAGTYTIELTKGSSTAKTGFCIITIGDTDYCTQQIGFDAVRGLTDARVRFVLRTADPIRVEILSHWGTSSCYGYEDSGNNPPYIEDNDEIDLTASSGGNNEPPSEKGPGDPQKEEDSDPSSPQPDSGTPVLPESVDTDRPGDSAQSGDIDPSGDTDQAGGNVQSGDFAAENDVPPSSQSGAEESTDTEEATPSTEEEESESQISDGEGEGGEPAQAGGE